MKKFFTIGEAAKLVGMTAETLRHYDRIGLVSPHKTDEWTKYRYYTEEEIVRLNTVRALRCMDLPLEDIRRVLQLNDVDEIVDFLEKTEQKAEEKIAELQEREGPHRPRKEVLRGQAHGSAVRCPAHPRPAAAGHSALRCPQRADR